jgi:large subunit ribosomal protein L33
MRNIFKLISIYIYQNNNNYNFKMAGKPKASKSKRSSILFKLVSTANTGYFYLVRRNPKQKPEKMLCSKFDPIVRKHVDFKEQKLSS